MSSEKSKALQFYLFNIKPYSDRIPYFRELAKSIWSIIWKFKLKLRSLWLSTNLEKIYWVNPRKINYALEKDEFRVSKYKYKRKISNKYGKFTGYIIKFEEKNIYQSFYQHFIRGKKWEQTDFYKSVINEIKDGQYKWGCSSISEYNRRCKGLDKLYYDIKNNGIKIQKMISGTVLIKENRIKEIKDEIKIFIDPKGELIHCNGQHRLAMAKILDLGSVPVQILHRHKKWIKFRKEIFYYIRKAMNGKAYHPLLHPDLRDIPSLWSDKRFKMIKQNLAAKKGTFLDIGAHWGFFCHKFEELGFQCTAMEGVIRNVYYMKKLKRAERLKFNIISKSIFDYIDCEDFEDGLCFDVVLALNLFNQIIDIEEKNLCSKFVEIFGKIKAKEMYFQVPEKGSMEKIRKTNKYKNGIISSQKLIDNIIKNTYFTYAEKIGEERNHGIYKLY